MNCNQNLELTLLAAVEANDLVTATEMIKGGADVNKRGPLNLTPLMIAAGRGYLQMTQLLLNAGADVYSLDSVTGASALHKAAQGGVVEVAELLLAHGAFLNLQSAIVGHTPLIDAVWSKKTAMVKFLLDRGAIINIKGHHGADVWEFVSDQPTWTAGFTIPRREKWGQEIYSLLQARQEADGKAEKQPLMTAVMAGDGAQVARLLAAGVNVNEASPIIGSGNDGQNPLLVACFLGEAEIVEQLLAAGANVQILDYLMKATPCHKAAYAGRPDAIASLLAHSNVAVNAQGPYNGYTALHDATWHGHKEVVEILLEANVKMNLKGHDGNTPLKLAQALGYEEIAQLIARKMQIAQ